MKWVHFINNFDFLSHEVKLTIDKNETRLKTLFGGILSLLSIIIMASFCLFFFIKLIQKDNTFVTISSESSQFSNISDSNNYPFLIRLTDKQNKPFTNPEQIFKIHLKYWYGGSSTLENVGQQNVAINIEPCDLNKHFGVYRSKFADITDLKTFYCPSARPLNETIYGRYGDIYPFGYYHFYVSMCMNNPHCLDLNEIKKITENVYLDFRTVDYSINNMKTKAKVETVRTDRHMLSSTVYKRIWVYLNSVKYITDTGLFFSTQSTEYFSQFESMRYDIDLRDIFVGTIPGTFATMTILNTGNTIIYNRKFLKLQEYLASVGGIAKFIQLAAFLLNFTFSKNTYYIKLINDLQVLQSLSEKETKQHLPLKNVNPFMNNMIAFSIEPRLELNDSKEFVDKKPIRRRDVLDDRLYKWYYRLLPMSVLNKKERDLFMKCIESINSRLNITTMLTRLEDTYLFVKTYLNEQQQSLYKPNKKIFNIPLKQIPRTKTPLNCVKFVTIPNEEKQETNN